MSSDKERLDKLLVERGLTPTRAQGRALIMAGDVTVNGQRVDKAGTPVARDADVVVKRPLPYVGRGGHKLAAALDAFDIQVAGRTCADVGACTGGFTDVLRQRQARRIYAIDVGYGQLDWKLRQDDRVVIMERTNARYLTTLPEPIALAVIDVSFISLRLILPVVRGWFDDASADGDIVALVKPQFEAGREQVGKGGIVKDPLVHQAVLSRLTNWAFAAGFGVVGAVPSPITGADGNREFLLWLRPKGGVAESELAGVVEQALLQAPNSG